MYVAKKFPKHASLSGWVGLLPPRTPRPSLDSAVTADVAINDARACSEAQPEHVRQASVIRAA